VLLHLIYNDLRSKDKKITLIPTIRGYGTNFNPIESVSAFAR